MGQLLLTPFQNTVGAVLTPPPNTVGKVLTPSQNTVGNKLVLTPSQNTVGTAETPPTRPQGSPTRPVTRLSARNAPPTPHTPPHGLAPRTTQSGTALSGLGTHVSASGDRRQRQRHLVVGHIAHWELGTNASVESLSKVLISHGSGFGDGRMVRGGCKASGETTFSEFWAVLDSRRSYVWALRSAAVGR